MPSERSKDIVYEMLGTTAMTNEKYLKACEIVDGLLIERDELANAITQVAKNLKITDAIELTGPQLILLAQDVQMHAECIAKERSDFKTSLTKIANMQLTELSPYARGEARGALGLKD
jgi:hypothetical protein